MRFRKSMYGIGLLRQALASNVSAASARLMGAEMMNMLEVYIILEDPSALVECPRRGILSRPSLLSVRE